MKLDKIKCSSGRHNLKWKPLQIGEWNEFFYIYVTFSIDILNLKEKSQICEVLKVPLYWAILHDETNLPLSKNEPQAMRQNSKIH